MKLTRLLLAVALILGLLTGCGAGADGTEPEGDTILATTYPMYYLTCRLTEGMEGVTVEQMITEAVSCLHDYTLTTEQMKKIERADLIVMNGCGLEDFMADALKGVPQENLVDCGSANFTGDPHYWLHPSGYQAAIVTASEALAARYPEQHETLDQNGKQLIQELCDLQEEMQSNTNQRDISCREMITFHDGFAYFADAMGLTIAAAIEEEEGAEPSANELKEICDLIQTHGIPAIFVEKNGSTNAAEIISRETGVKVYTLTTIMDGQTDYFTAMRENAAAVKEALS